MSNINNYKYIYMYKCMYKSVKCVYNTKNYNLSANHLLFLLITRFNNNLVIILKYTHLNIIMCKLRSIKKVPLYILNCLNLCLTKKTFINYFIQPNYIIM